MTRLVRFAAAAALALTLGSSAGRANGPGGGHHGPGPSHGHWHGHGFDGVKERIELSRPDPAVDADADGHLHLSEHRGRSSIKVHVNDLDPGAVYTVKIAKGDASATLGEITIPAPKPPPPPRSFQASLSGDQETPPVETEASGKASLLLTGSDRTTLRYEIHVRGLSGDPIAAHIHQGAPGVPGDVLIPLDHEDLHGSTKITPEQVAALESGNTYVNVHTAAHEAGEIRGQIKARPVDDDDRDDRNEGRGKLLIDTKRGDTLPLDAKSLSDLNGSIVTVLDKAGAVILSGKIEDIPAPPPPPPPRCFSAELSGAQEVPPVETEAKGKARFHLYGRDNDRLFYDFDVEGLSGPPTAAHIHAGAPGVPGDVLIPLDAEVTHGSVKVTPEQLAQIVAGNTYINVHTAAHETGEIRGQIAVCGSKPPGDPADDGGNDDGTPGAESPAGTDDFFDETDFEETGPHDASFVRGDANADRALDLADAISVLGILFLGAPLPYCVDAADASDDGLLDLSDSIAILQSLFGSAGPLPPPGADGRAGYDLTADELFCEEGQ